MSFPPADYGRERCCGLLLHPLPCSAVALVFPSPLFFLHRIRHILRIAASFAYSFHSICGCITSGRRRWTLLLQHRLGSQDLCGSWIQPCPPLPTSSSKYKHDLPPPAPSCRIQIALESVRCSRMVLGGRRSAVVPFPLDTASNHCPRVETLPSFATTTAHRPRFRHADRQRAQSSPRHSI
jgi:hypothetical protein